MSICFTYLIGWSKLNKWYYGRKTAKNCHPDNLWKTYFTSSKHVKQFRKDHGDPDIIQIRKTFTSVFECIKWENTVLRRLKVSKKDKWLNKTNGDLKFDTTGLPSPMKGVKRPDIAEKNKKGNSLETRIKISKTRKERNIVPYNKGKKGLQNAWNKGFTSATNSSIITGNKHSSKRKEVREKISLSNTGKIFSQERKNSIKTGLQNLSILQCPFCNINSKSRSNMKRYHFDNCKDKNDI